MENKSSASLCFLALLDSCWIFQWLTAGEMLDEAFVLRGYYCKRQLKCSTGAQADQPWTQQHSEPWFPMWLVKSGWIPQAKIWFSNSNTHVKASVCTCSSIWQMWSKHRDSFQCDSQPGQRHSSASYTLFPALQTGIYVSRVPSPSSDKTKAWIRQVKCPCT